MFFQHDKHRNEHFISTVLQKFIQIFRDTVSRRRKLFHLQIKLSNLIVMIVTDLM